VAAIEITVKKYVVNLSADEREPGRFSETGAHPVCRFLRCLYDAPLDARRRQVSGKRQGTKSRSGWGGLAAMRYGL
jgi:hypothetical protein